VSTVVLDPTPEGLDLPPPDQPAASAPGRTARVEQLARIAAAQLAVPRRLARETVARAFTTDPRDAARQAREAAGVVAELTRVRPVAPDTRLNQTIGGERLFATARGRLDDVKAVRRAADATVNDVLLATVSLALSEFLGEESPERAVALVPVSIRAEGEGNEVANRISTVFCDLPLRGDPLERVRRISAEMARVKDSAQVRAGALIAGATGLAPPIVSSLAVRAMSGPRIFNLVVSNVPGPQQTFYLAGVPMREVYPAVPLNPRNQALSIGIVSYDGGVHFGVLADRDALPDMRAMAAALERGLGTLVEVAA
jgi:WS/DGAT/MGAT family acyltransferase